MRLIEEFRAGLTGRRTETRSMILSHGQLAPIQRASARAASLLTLALLGLSIQAAHAFPDYPVTGAQRGTAQ